MVGNKLKKVITWGRSYGGAGGNGITHKSPLLCILLDLPTDGTNPTHTQEGSQFLSKLTFEKINRIPSEAHSDLNQYLVRAFKHC